MNLVEKFCDSCSEHDQKCPSQSSLLIAKVLNGAPECLSHLPWKSLRNPSSKIEEVSS